MITTALGATALLLLATSAKAAIIGVVPLQSGAMLRLHDEPRICVNGALLVEYAMPGKPTISGCWVRRGDAIHAAFLDGDAGEIPVQAIKRPESI